MADNKTQMPMTSGNMSKNMAEHAKNMPMPEHPMPKDHMPKGGMKQPGQKKTK